VVRYVVVQYVVVAVVLAVVVDGVCCCVVRVVVVDGIVRGGWYNACVYVVVVVSGAYVVNGMCCHCGFYWCKRNLLHVGVQLTVVRRSRIRHTHSRNIRNIVRNRNAGATV